jgi:hypothetical protein
LLLLSSFFFRNDDAGTSTPYVVMTQKELQQDDAMIDSSLIPSMRKLNRLLFAC